MTREQFRQLERIATRREPTEEEIAAYIAARTPEQCAEDRRRIAEIIERAKAGFDAEERPYTPQLQSAIDWLARTKVNP